MKYLIDTNVISELYKKKPDIRVIDWFKNAPSEDLYISCITVGELKSGALKKSKKDQVAGESLFTWIDDLVNNYSEQIIEIDLKTCDKWAELLNIDSTNAIDSLIAAQAMQENMTLVTRNIKHFKMFDIELCNPFDEELSE